MANLGIGVRLGNYIHLDYNEITESRIKGDFDKTVNISDRAIIRDGVIIYIGCHIGIKTMIGHYAIIREATAIGDHCKIGHHVVIEGATQIGNHTSIYSQCHITAYSKIGSYVFMGPMTVTTNDSVMSYKRPEIEIEYNGITILDGARIGSGCIIFPGITIGKEALIGAGSLVTKDIPDYAIAYGSPARIIGRISDDALLKNNRIDI